MFWLKIPVLVAKIPNANGLQSCEKYLVLVVTKVAGNVPMSSTRSSGVTRTAVGHLI